MLIGRDAGNDLVLRQPSVSARHARVLVGPDGIWIEDLGSRNGTFVGTPPRRIDRERISLDDPLVFGDVALPATALRDYLERTKPRPPANGVSRQQGSTATMIFDVWHIVHYLSQFLTLEAGDVVITGTPPGVGMAMKPPVYLTAGDVVTLSIDGLGSQRSVCENARIFDGSAAAT